MPTIVRQPKAQGGTTYQEETAAGKLDIIDAEIDVDFDTLYKGINLLDNSNINPQSAGQRIVYEKLNLTGKIVPGDLASGFVIPTNGVNKDSLVVGATIQDQKMASSDALTSVPDTNELLVAEVTWTSRGGFYLVWAKVIGGFPAGIASDTVWHTHLRLDGTAGNPNDGTVIDYAITRTHRVDLPPDSSGAAIVFPISHPMMAQGALLSAGVHRLKLTVKVDLITYAGLPYVEDRKIIVMESA